MKINPKHDIRSTSVRVMDIIRLCIMAHHVGEAYKLPEIVELADRIGKELGTTLYKI